MKRAVLSACVAFATLSSTTTAWANDLPPGVTMGYDGSDLGATPSMVHTAGYRQPGSVLSYSDTDGAGPIGGSILEWFHDGVNDYVKYVYGTMRFPTPDGKGIDGRILHYSLTSRSNDNGYMLIAKQNVPDLVTVLKGNVDYVQDGMKVSKLVTPSIGQSWPVVAVPQIVALCGGTIDYIGGDAAHAFLAGSDGKTALPAFKITPTPSPTTRIDLAGSTVTVGDKIPVKLHSEVYAAATAWHQSAVRIYNSSGVNEYFAIDGHPAAHGVTWTGGGLVAITGGGSGDPSRPKVYDETATLDTTGMEPGTYTIEYTLFDNVARPSASAQGNVTSGSVTKQITLQPPATPTNGGGGNGGGGGTAGGDTPSPGPGKNAVLIQEFEKPKTIMLNSWGTEGWKITNNSSVAITTTLTASLETYVDLPFEYTYQSGWRTVRVGTDPQGNPIYDQAPVYTTVTRYAMHKAHETETKTFTVPSKGSVRWDIGKDMRVEIEGGPIVNGMGLSPFGPWVPDGGKIPGSGTPDTAGNNNGHVAESSQVGINDGKLWLPRLTVTAKDPEHYYSPVISQPIITIPLNVSGPVPPVLTK